jgi:hypothetical protein
MAKLYKKTIPGVTFACYSERGIVAYYMFRVLHNNPKALLNEIENGAGRFPFHPSKSAT